MFFSCALITDINSSSTLLNSSDLPKKQQSRITSVERNLASDDSLFEPMVSFAAGIGRNRQFSRMEEICRSVDVDHSNPAL